MRNLKRLLYINGRFPAHSFNLYAYWNTLVYQVYRHREIIVYLRYVWSMHKLNRRIPKNKGVGKHPIYSFREFMSPVKDPGLPNYPYKSPYHHFKATQ